MYECAMCGTTFDRAPKRGRVHRYCSRTCSNRAKAERERGQYEAIDCGYVSPCWVRRTAGRYAKVTVGDRTLSWHRFMFERVNGPIPADLHLDHLCEVTACGRPDHLEAVTPAENIRRSWARGRRDHLRGKRAA